MLLDLLSYQYLLLGLVVSFVLVVHRHLTTSKKQKAKNDDEFSFKLAPVASTFDWRLEEPIPYRPFKKGPYNLTMGLKNLAQDEWLLLENTYLDRTNLRKEIVADKIKDAHTVITHPDSAESLCEYYDITLDYLQQKYPQYFYIKKSDPSLMFNAIRNESIYKESRLYKGDLKKLVHTLSRTIEEDFLIMMNDEKTQKYFLRGGAFVFPSGLDPAEKANLSLADIHGPVPFYKEKIEKSMDKFFQRLKTGHFVLRVNWTCQAHNELYAVGLNHALEGEETPILDAKNIDFNHVFLRCERQCLMRLPKTKAVVFTIRTYLTPMSKIRKEDGAMDLVSAIEHLPPSTAHYKRAEQWGDAVISYLRGDTDGLEV